MMYEEIRKTINDNGGCPFCDEKTNIHFSDDRWPVYGLDDSAIWVRCYTCNSLWELNIRQDIRGVVINGQTIV